jgi:Response regulator containing CheY-like receiver domain and AraC-type DNA-binding domain
MNRVPMMVQLMLILFCVMAVPMSVLTWYSGTSILGNSESAIADSSMAALNASRRLNENALNNLSQDAVRLAATNIFDRIRNYESFSELNSQYSNMSNALSVLKELLNLNHRVEGVYSSYFYLDGADYVISTDKGITMLERYESIDWMEEALADRRGISGVWYPRRLSSGVNVVSYLFPLSRLSTTTRGTVVVNLRESQVGNYLQSSVQGEQGYLLMDGNGTIISHNDKSLLLTDGSQLPHMRQILDSGTLEGHAFHEVDGKRLLYTWSSSKLFDWWNVQIYSVDQLMTTTYKLQRSITWITVLIIFIGAVLSVVLATWLSKPIRKLVRNVRGMVNLGTPSKNELTFLEAAFKRMQEEEGELYRLLEERERDTRSLAVHKLLRGEVAEQVKEIFPDPHFTVAVVSIDRYGRYVSKNNHETRSYHRYLLASKCEGLFPEGTAARCIYQGQGTFALVINYGEQEAGDTTFEGLKNALVHIRDGVLELLGHSVTIGVSSRSDSAYAIPRLLAEGAEAIKRRMTDGIGRVFYWEREPDSSKKYIYPANSERRILNFLETGSLESVLKELQAIREEIHAAESVSYDNILFIYNQLVGVTIKHLRENNVNTARIFAGQGNIYSTIASVDTLEELEKHLKTFFGEIVQYLARNHREANHGEKIIRYLETHYCEDIVFEDMAKEIGISYSYMRKIVYELTGKSLIEYTNSLRIERAKQLLVETDLTIAQIASEVGYSNIQSFNRFFRKYEGMPPSGYKAVKTGAS